MQSDEKNEAVSSWLDQKHALFKVPDYAIPKLPLLDDMVARIKAQPDFMDLSHTVVIGAQHILETTVTLFDALMALGVKPAHMFFSGKCYSTAPEIEVQVKKRGIHLMPSNKPDSPGEYEHACQKGLAHMWKFCLRKIQGKPIDRIIILDDGGRCFETMPEYVVFQYAVAVVEQTRAGLYSELVNSLPCPIIQVAVSAAKKLLESPMIAEAVLKRVSMLLLRLNPDENTVFGVIGNGAIGDAISRYLLNMNHKVIVYDPDENSFKNIINKKFFRMKSVEDVIALANITFGCTGKDVTKNLDILGLVKKDKILMSCTSEDKEFRTLLRTIHSQYVDIDPLSDVVCRTKNGKKITILQGGFPINFDRKPWNVPHHQIELTQGLLLGGCLQAALCAKKPVDDGITVNEGSQQALDPVIQSYAALHWLPRQTMRKNLEQYKKAFGDMEWIKNQSGGHYYRNDFMTRCFSEAEFPRLVSKL